MKLHNAHVRVWQSRIKQKLNGYKKQAYDHCKTRAKEHYNFDLTPIDYEYILNSIIGYNKGAKSDTIMPIKACPNKSTVWQIVYKGKLFTVVYLNKGTKKKLIKTFLSRNWAKKRGL